MENARKRIEVMPPAETMPPRVKPRSPRWGLIAASIGTVAIVLLVLVMLMLRPRPKNAHGTIPVAEVQTMSGNNYNGCGGGVTVCKYSFPANVTKGNALVV